MMHFALAAPDELHMHLGVAELHIAWGGARCLSFLLLLFIAKKIATEKTQWGRGGREGGGWVGIAIFLLQRKSVVRLLLKKHTLL